MPSKTDSQSGIKTRESKTSSSSSKGSSHSTKKSTSSSKSKPEQKELSKLKPEEKEPTKIKSKTSSLTKSISSSKNVKNDLVNKNSVNISKSKSSTPSNKSSKVSSSSNAASEKKGSLANKSSSGKSSLESSGSRKLESKKKEQRSSHKDEDSKSEKRKLNSKESREKGSKNTKEVSKTSLTSSSRNSPRKSTKEISKTSLTSSSQNSPRKSSTDNTKSKKHEEKTKSQKPSKSKKIDEKIDKAKPEKSEKTKPEKTEKIKLEKTEKSKTEKTKPEKIEKIKSEKMEKTKAEKIEKTKPEIIEEIKSEKIKAEKIEKAKPEIIEKIKPDIIEETKELEKLSKSEDSPVKEKGEIDRIEKPIEIDNKEIIGKDLPDMINTTVNPNDNSLETLESGISMTSPNELSDGEVEESISSRFVEVDEMEYPSPPSSSINLHSSSQPPRNDSKLDVEEEEDDQEKGIKEDNMYMDYEDDFENYESDFEDDEDDNDDDESDEESVDDDVEEEEEEDDDDDDDDSDDDDEDDSDENVEADKDFKELKEPDPQMVAVLMALEVENRRPKTRASQNAQGETNYQEIKTGQETSYKSSKNRPKTSRAYVNFNKAKERAKGEKASDKMKNRGQILLEMIQLDTISIDLFIQVSDSYESYIAAFGTTNTLQTSTQTNDDAISEEIQTESLPLLNKWTQKPINISVKGDYLPTPEDFLGVGGDSVQEDEENELTTFKPLSFDSGHLTKFLSSSSQVVLMLLEEESVFKNDSLGSGDDEDLGFGKTGIDLGSGMNSLLKGRKATFVSFCSSDPLIVVTGHSFQDPNNNATGFVSKERSSKSLVEDEEGLETQIEEPKPIEETSDVSFSENGAYLCVWSIRQPSFPQRILSCHSSPRVACFSPGRPVALVAGLTDGSLAAWDFRESLANHPITVSFGDDKKWRLSPPSFITACHREGFIGGSEIVAIEAIGSHEEHNDNFGSFQVVSLSALGQLTWWVIVQGDIQPMKITDLNSSGILTEHGAAPWSRIIISRAASLSVDDMLPQSEDEFPGSNMCYDLKLSSSDSNQIYVAIANGRVLHCSRHNIKLHPSSFIPEIEPGNEAVSISVCPHDPLYLLVGGNDGLIGLHSITSPSPLTCWQASNNPAPVRKVEWSPSRPCVFYMLDCLGMFHLWDLSAGDIYPIVSVEKGGLIDGDLTDFNIASSSTEMNQPLHAVFASESGIVSIRSVSSQFLRSSEEEYKNELERFRCYVSII